MPNRARFDSESIWKWPNRTHTVIHPRVKLIRKIFKTCSDIWIFLDGRNVQRNVGLASKGRAPQQRKMQNAKGIKKKLSHQVVRYFVGLWPCMFYQSWMSCKSMTGLMTGTANSWLVGWSWLISHGGDGVGAQETCASLRCLQKLLVGSLTPNKKGRATP